MRRDDLQKVTVAGISGVFSGVLQKDDGDQIQKKFKFVGRNSGYLGAISQDDLVEDGFVDAGEVGLDITLHVESRCGKLAHKLRESGDGGVGTAGCSIRKGVVDKSLVKKRHDMAGKPAMNDSVAKARSKYLPYLGVLDHKAVISSWPVGSGGQLLCQFTEQIVEAGSVGNVVSGLI